MANPYNIVVQLDAFSGDRAGDREDLGHSALLALLDFLVTVNRNYLRKYKNTPRVYEAGIRYEYEIPGIEEWQDIPTTIAKGFGDCEDLATWRCAELIERDHVPAKPAVTWSQRPDGGWLYHIRVLILNPDGTTKAVEDPSKMLGMR